MKKFLAIILALAMLLSLAACGGGGDAENNDAPETTQAAADDTQAADEEPAVAEIAIAEEVEGVGEAILSNSYLEFKIPEGIGFYIDDANQQEGDSIFQVILDLKNEDGNKIGELLINNRGGLESADEYANVILDQYADSDATKVELKGSATYGSFDVRHLTLDVGYQIDNRYVGYYQLPDENAEHRNVYFEMEILGYYYPDGNFPVEACEAIMNSIVIK